MSAVPKTSDFDLRALVVRILLNCAVPRDAIRHEITLDSSSSEAA